MMRMIAACFVCLGMVLSTGLPVRGAAPPTSTHPGNMDFLSPDQGWIELSSSAGYSQICQTSDHPPAACNRAVTELFRTSDGGRTWTRELRFTSQPLVGGNYLPQVWMHVFSPSTVLAMTFAFGPPRNNFARIYRTDNGGRTWGSSLTPASRSYGVVSPTDVTFVGPNHLWLLRHDGAAMGSEQVSIFRTGNAGVQWTQTACTAVSEAVAGCRKASGILFGGHKDNIVFESLTHGWITESDASGIPSLYVTHDGGYQWVLTRPGLPRGVPAPNARTATYPYGEYQQPIVFGSFVILPVMVNVCSSKGRNTTCRSGLYALLSFDGGRTWTASRHIPAPAGDAVSAAWQVMSSHTWWSVAGSRLWGTNDAGQHWRSTPLHLPGGGRLLQIQFVSPTAGWAIAGQTSRNDSYAQHVTLLRTSDGGRSWSEVPLPAISVRVGLIRGG
jgi:photosystem II stability/assembly factor-like uncharacterized protein